MTDKTKRRKLEQTDKSSILKSLCREKGGGCSVSSQNSRFFDHLFQEEIDIKYSPGLISSLSIRWPVTWPGGGGAVGSASTEQWMHSLLARKKLFFSRTITAETGYIFRSASKSVTSSRFVSGTQRSAVSSKVHLNITCGWLCLI